MKIKKEQFLLTTIDFHAFGEGLVRAIEAKDKYTAGHSDRVAILSQMIALTMGMSDSEADYIHIAGHIHDIGKIGVPDGILLKGSDLNAAEYTLIKQHCEVGWQILKDIPGLKELGKVILYHHERYDGKGYPHGIKGEDIPLGSRIISVADAFDSLTTTRTYRKSVAIEQAMDVIIESKGTHFDPEVCDALLSIYNRDNNLVNPVKKDILNL